MKLITCHINPDFDAIASCVAVKKLYSDSTIFFPSLPKRSKKNFIIQSTIYSYMVDFDKVNLNNIDTLIIVDTHSENRIGKFKQILHRVYKICFDHHDDGEIKCDEFYNKKTGANTTQIILKIMEQNIYITQDEATLFMLGIYEDTGKLQFSNTTPLDFEACAYLMKCGADLNIVSNILMETLNETEISLLNELLRNKRIYEIGSMRVFLSFASHDNYLDDAAILVTKLMSITGTNIVLCMFRMASKIYVIGRSKEKKFHMGNLMKKLGGGGHRHAASTTLNSSTLFEALENINNVLQAEILNHVGANEIMSYPPKYVYTMDTIDKADYIMTKFSINALVVLNKNKIEGIITRQTVQKVRFHHLENELVGSFMDTEFEYVVDIDGFEKIRDIMISKKQKIIPVISHLDNKLVGVITRTNLLKIMSGISSLEEVKKPLNITEKLKKSLPEKVLEYLKLAGMIAKSLGFRAYLVGGIVRDIMLEIDNLDIDIVIEGNGISFAYEYGKKLNAKVVIHERFKTATLILQDNFRIDIATAREEYYELPGVLPIVETSSIKLDLYRRDFTINTLAIKLSDNFGDLLDFFGGLNDIKTRKIRILHSLSFVEDPTRIFRAIRFAARFSFEIGEKTKRLIKTALDLGLLQNVSKLRIFREIVIISRSNNPETAFRLLDKYGILKALNSEFTIDEKAFSYIRSLNDTLKGCEVFCKDKIIQKELPYLILLEYLFMKKMDFLQTIGADEKTTSRVKNVTLNIDSILRIICKEKISNDETYYTLRKYSLEEVLAIFTISKNNKNIGLYLEHLINIKPLISGKDLLQLGLKPSPIFSQIIDDVLKKQLTNKIIDKTEAIEYIKEHYRTK